MKRMLAKCVGLAVVASFVCIGAQARAGDDPPKASQEPDKGTTRERVDALISQYNKAMQAFSENYQKAKTDEDRQKLFQSEYPKNDEYAAKLLQIAKESPSDPAAFDALVWVVQRGNEPTATKSAIEQLKARHAKNAGITQALPSLEYAATPAGRELLEVVLKENPDRNAKGLAAFVLANKLKGDAENAKRLIADPSLLPRFEEFYGKEEAARMKGQKPEELSKQAEELFERVVQEFGDVRQGDRTLADAANGVLFELRFLAVGKVAPDVEGEDIDGNAFKLSDYRGKVVLVDFWGDW